MGGWVFKYRYTYPLGPRPQQILPTWEEGSVSTWLNLIIVLKIVVGWKQAVASGM